MPRPFVAPFRARTGSSVLVSLLGQRRDPPLAQTVAAWGRLITA